MGSVNQARVRSGFDVEVLLGSKYIQMILGTALDAGVIPPFATVRDREVAVALIPQEFRLYPPNKPSEDVEFQTHESAFETEILFDHELGANLRIRAMLGEPNLIPILDFDCFVATNLIKEVDEEGAISKVGLEVSVVEVASSLMQLILSETYTIDMLLADVKAAVDRTIDLGGASKFKKVEDLAIRWHEEDADHAACLGIYINTRMRNGDPDEDFLPRRGDLQQARNFLPKDEDIAMASRPGMYADMARHVFCSTSVELPNGSFDHALRKSLLKPTSERIGDLHRVKVMPIPSIPPAIENGLRIQIEGEVTDPIDLTNTDVTMTVDLRPFRADDGTLAWSTDFNVDIDATFEFTTIWAAGLLFILFGPAAALYFMGAVFLVDLGVGIGIGIAKEGKVEQKANATLADVIPDRLTISTRRSDPFYATLHQVVTKPSQAEFNAVGFRMCGKAFIGRELVPPINTVIRDVDRDADGQIVALRYEINDFEKVIEESQTVAPGTSQRDFDLPPVHEMNLWPLTLDQFRARLNDPEGPLVLSRIPYFQACVFVRDNQIDGILCLSGPEVEALQDQIRDETRQRGYDRIMNLEGAAIEDEVRAELGPGASDEDVAAEVDRRVSKKVKVIMDDYRAPVPLRLARDGSLEPLLRLDLTPEELVMLQKEQVLLIDNGQLKTIKGRRVSTHIRDRRHFGDEEEGDNLLERPRYRRSTDGPVFR